MFKLFNFLFINFLIGGSVIAISSNSWFTCWLGLEINMMSMIPLILYKLIFNLTEAAIKYFIVQALASIILILSSVLSINFLNMMYLNLNDFFILLALVIKSGLAPVHIWFPQIMMLLSWFQCSLMLTWQKVAPLFLISNYNSSKLIYFFAISSVFIGSLGGFNQILIKLILTYSSIAHSGWMLVLANCSAGFLFNYFIIYVMMTLSIILPALKFNLGKISDFSFYGMNFLSKMLFSVSIFSLGGLPPFAGFTAKISAIKNMLPTESLVVILILILSSLFSLFYYFKLIYSFLGVMNEKSKIFQLNSLNKLNIFLIFSLFFNLMFPLLVIVV